MSAAGAMAITAAVLGLASICCLGACDGLSAQATRRRVLHCAAVFFVLSVLCAIAAPWIEVAS